MAETKQIQTITTTTYLGSLLTSVAAYFDLVPEIVFDGGLNTDIQNKPIITDGGFDNVGIGVTAGFTLYLSSNDSEPLNTDNQLNGLSASPSTMIFDDLTGIDIESTVGDGVYAKSGNTIICTSDGSIRKLKLDNGSEFLINEGNGIIWSSNGLMRAKLSNFTWTYGVDTPIIEGTQTALVSYNQYSRFDGLTNAIELNIFGFDLVGKKVKAKFIYDPNGSDQNVYTNGISFSKKCAFGIDSTGAIGCSFFGAGGGNGHFINAATIGLKVGEPVEIIADVTDYDNVIVTVNGTPTDISTALLTSVNLGERIGARTPTTNRFQGILINLETGDLIYNDRTEFLGNAKTGVFNTSLIPENTTVIGFDIFGTEIFEPLLVDGYNFSNNNHFLDTQILDHTNAGSLGFWIRPKTNEGNEVFAFDDVLSVFTDGNSILKVTFNGVTLDSEHTLVKGTAYFVKFTQDAAQVGKIYIGTEPTAPLEAKSGAVGLPVAATAKMRFGSEANTYLTQPTFHPFEEILTEITIDYIETKSKIANGTFKDPNSFLYVYAMGQSNMVGASPSGSAPTYEEFGGDLTNPTNVYVPDGFGGWKLARYFEDPFSLKGNNIAITMCRELADKYGVEIRMIFNAEGSKAIAEWISPNSMWLDLTDTIDTFKIGGVLNNDIRPASIWIQHQGESDNGSNYATYFPKWDTVRSQLLSADIITADHIWIGGEVSIGGAPVNDALKQIADDNNDYKFVFVDGIEKHDTLHFLGRGLEEIGGKYLERYEELKKGAPTPIEYTRPTGNKPVASMITANDLVLTWTAMAVDPALTLVSYEIYTRNGYIHFDSVSAGTLSTTVNFTFAPATTEGFMILALDSAGNYTPFDDVNLLAVVVP